MKILFLYPNLNSNPNFKPLINVANYLANQKIQVYIAVQGMVNNTTKQKFDHSIVFLTRDNKQSKLSKLSWAYHLMHQDFDCLIGVQAHNAYWLAIAKMLSLKSKKVISWEHSSPITSIKSENPSTWPFLLTLRFLLSHSTDAFFCVSEGAVLQMQKLIKTSNQKVYYTPNMVFKTDDLKSISKSTKDSTLNIISVSRLSKEKGLILALQALAKLTDIDFNYLIVGDGPCYDELSKFVKDNPSLTHKVQLLGKRDNVLSLMANSDLILLPSYYEGLPTVLVEACITNTPIIAADCETGPSEIVKEGVNGYLFKVGNVEDLYNKINLWIKNRDLIKNDVSFALDYSESASMKFLNNIKRVVND